MAQTAMVKSAANSLALLPALAKRTTPSGIQAKGDTGLSTWMIGSNILEKLAERPSRKPMGVPRIRAMA